jgi:hypothetical protein
MAYTLRPTRLAYVMLAVEALKFAGEQPGADVRTREKIAIALASARRDLARVKRTRKKKKTKKK